MKCVFCDIVAKRVPAHIVYEDKDTLAFLDKYPHTRGHLQLIPKIHYSWIYEIPNLGSFFVTAGRIIRGIIPILKADHVTLTTFGHQIDHAHLWIVPQYKTYSKITETGGKRTEGVAELASQLRTQLAGGGVLS